MDGYTSQSLFKKFIVETGGIFVNGGFIFIIGEGSENGSGDIR